MEKTISILYVDDEPINLMLFELNFKGVYNVITAQSGIDALQKLNENHAITIVISDMRMPGMNGIEFIKKAKILYPQVIYFILTGYDITEEIAAAIDEKLINKYFSKPFNIKEISISIKEALS